VLVVHADRPLRHALRTMLADEGYAASDAPTYTAVLRHLRTAAEPAVVVIGNSRADFTTEAEFLGTSWRMPLSPDGTAMSCYAPCLSACRQTCRRH
jgi:hypothetical protein